MSEEPAIYHRFSESTDLSLLITQRVDQLLKTKYDDSAIIPTGFKQFDADFGGFSEGELIVVGGRPGMGKTMFIISLALNISSSRPVCFYSYDLSNQNLQNRFLSALSEIPVQDIILYNRNTDNNKKLFLATEKIQGLQIRINSSFNRNIEDLHQSILSEIRDNSCKVFFIDNLQSLKSRSYFKRRDLELGFILTELKELAHRYNVTIIATSHLNRSLEYRGGNKRPLLADLRDSGNIEQEPDKVILLHCPEYYGFLEDENQMSLKRIMMVDLVKNRNGEVGTVNLLKNKSITRLIDVDEYQYNINISKDRLDEFDKDAPF